MPVPNRNLHGWTLSNMLWSSSSWRLLHWRPIARGYGGTPQRLTLEEKWDVLKALNIIVTWHPEWLEPKIEGGLPPELFSIVNNSFGTHDHIGIYDSLLC